MQALFRLLLFIGVVWVGGFLWFAASLPRAGSVTLEQAGAVQPDETGIVALTGGGGKRIEAAFDLLASQSADRMLITGVHPDTRKSELAANLPDSTALFDCCIDLGQRALTTRGNAVETKDWVEERGYRRIILVTTDYHIPRARAELRRALPDVEIINWPVPSRVAPAEGWLTSPGALTVLAKEYTKFLAVRALQILNID